MALPLPASPPGSHHGSTATLASVFIVLAALLCGVFARLAVAATTPPFIDEVIHISVAVTPEQTGTVLTFPVRVANGKFTGYFLYEILNWMPASNWAPGSLFMHGRYISVFFFALTLLNFYLIGRALQLRWFAPLVSVMWAASPLMLFNEGLALQDPFACWLIASGVLLSIYAFKYDRAWLHVATATLLSLAVTTKAFNLAVCPFILLGGIWLTEASLGWPSRWGRLLGLWCAGFVLPIIPPAIYILFHWKEFTAGLQGLIAIFFYKGPQSAGLVQNALHTARGQVDNFIVYDLGLILAGVLLTSALSCRRSHSLKPILRFAICVAPFVALMILKTVYSRYYLCFLVPCLIVLVRDVVVILQTSPSFCRRAFVAVIAVFFCANSIVKGVTLYRELSAPLNTRMLTAMDRQQYLYGWASGAGTAETAAFLRATVLSSKTDVLVGLFSPGTGHSNLTLPQLMGDQRHACYMVNFYDWKSVEQFVHARPGAARYFVLEDNPTVAWPLVQIKSLIDYSYVVFKYDRPFGSGSYKVYRYDPTAVATSSTARVWWEHGHYQDGWSEPDFLIRAGAWPEGNLPLELWNPSPLPRKVSLVTQRGQLDIELKANETRRIEVPVYREDSIRGVVTPAFNPKKANRSSDDRDLGLIVQLPPAR